MLVLLPPSEGKAAGASGPALDLDALSLPELTAARTAVLEELAALCSGGAASAAEGFEDKACEVLGLGKGLRGEVAKNAALRTAPTLPAGELYTGVLYDALGLATLDAAARERAERWLLVFSGLWGALRITDRVPSYRCSGGVKLPGLGGLGPYWREPLDAVMPEVAGDGPVLDLRSAAYAAMWRPRGTLAERTAAVRVLRSEVVGGVEKRSVVGHFNKAAKGRVVRALLAAGEEPAGPAELAEVLRGLGHTAECEPPARRGTPWRLDLVVDEL